MDSITKVTYEGNWASEGGGCEAAVTARARCGLGNMASMAKHGYGI